METINMNQQAFLCFETIRKEIGHDSEIAVKVAHENLRIRFQKRLSGKEARFELKVTKKSGSFYFIDVKPDAVLTKDDLLQLEELALIQTSYRLAKNTHRWMY